MTIQDEFLEILRILAEDPQPSAKKPPCTDSDPSGLAADSSSGCGHGKGKEAAS
jgi:hypothetical protein